LLWLETFAEMAKDGGKINPNGAFIRRFPVSPDWYDICMLKSMNTEMKQMNVMSFNREAEAFRQRMQEQLCHIEAYRQQVWVSEGRQLSRQQAAAEWIERYAAKFPAIAPAILH